MRRPLLVVTVLLCATLTFTPPASAAANGCAVFSPGPDVPLPGLQVPPGYPNAFTGPCAGGLEFVSATAACPSTAAPVALPGEYCGATPGFPPGALVTCTGRTPVEVWYEALVVGLDFFPYDGNIGLPLPLPIAGGLGLTEPLVYDDTGGLSTVHSASIVNTSPLPARVIAYPVGVVDVPGSGYPLYVEITCV